MSSLSPQQIAGKNLRRLIQENFPSQEEFAFEYGLEIRTVSRYINNGINKIDAIQSLADFFKVDFMAFFIEKE